MRNGTIERPLMEGEILEYFCIRCKAVVLAEIIKVEDNRRITYVRCILCGKVKETALTADGRSNLPRSCA